MSHLSGADLGFIALACAAIIFAVGAAVDRRAGDYHATTIRPYDYERDGL